MTINLYLVLTRYLMLYFGRNPFRSLGEHNNIYGDFIGENLQKGLGWGYGLRAASLRNPHIYVIACLNVMKAK